MYSFEHEGIRYSLKSDRGRAILKEQMIDFMADIVISLGMVLIGLIAMVVIAINAK